MLRYAEARALILEQATQERALRSHEPIVDRVGLDQALGCIAAHEILSPRAVPPFDNSAMDGFAIRSEWTRGASVKNPLRFSVRGSVVAGDLPPKADATPGVWEIMTGAPFPEGLDAALRIEDVQVRRDRQGVPLEIEVTSEAEPRQFRRGAGEDFALGATVLQRGTQLEPEHLLALASLGIREVSVERKPRVAVLSTGQELAPLGAEPRPGQIFNSTAHFLRAALPRLGVEYLDGGTVGDEPQLFRRELERLLSGPHKPDVLITTGAVSMGKHDFVQSTLSEMGATHFFHKVAIRPGKPLLFSKIPDGPVVFGLPGNPVSTVVGLRFFVEPYVRALLGRPQEIPLKARLSHSVGKPDGLRCFFKARYCGGGDLPSVTILPGQLSFLVRPLLEANGWAVLGEDGTQTEQGSLLDFYPPYSLPYDWMTEAPCPPRAQPHAPGCCS